MAEQTTQRAQVYLQPIAAPSILGLYGFAGATFIVAAHLPKWYGGAETFLFVFPFAGEELKRLRQENKILKQKRDFLKKAVAIFPREDGIR
jgi:hypothetical protein